MRDASNTRILVVEDDPALLRMLGKMLEQLGQVDTAGDGHEALTKARAWSPHVVVTDLMMPGMDGLTLARELKKDPALGKVPVVMLTAKDTPKDVIAGINAGARHYLTKPFKQDALLEKVKKALRR